MRCQIRATCGRGFTVREQAGAAQLTVLYSDGSRRSIALRLPWTPERALEIATACQAAADLVRAGKPLPVALRQSRLVASGAVDWPALLETYRTHRLHTVADLNQHTWHKKFVPVGQLLAAGAPSDPGAALACVATGEPGSRGRQIKLQAVSALLTWAVAEGLLPPSWTPPPTSRYLGRKLQQRQPRPVPTDADILELIAGLDGAPRRAVLVLAVFGLRPWEITYLEPAGDCVRVTKGKVYAGGQTQPRVVSPLPPLDAQGVPATGLVAEALVAIREGALPPIGNPARTQALLDQRLQRRPAWRAFGGTLYSLRHAYAHRCHRLGLAPKDAAALMGHSLQSHLAHYSALRPDEAVLRARMALAAATGVDMAAALV